MSQKKIRAALLKKIQTVYRKQIQSMSLYIIQYIQLFIYSLGERKKYELEKKHISSTEFSETQTVELC